MAFSVEDLDRAVTSRTKAIIVNTPANPSGKVFSREELEDIAGIAVKHDLFILTDEIYEYFLYDDRKHISPGSLEQIADRTITISGPSKTYSITGWRIGYSVSDARWSHMIGYMNDLIYVCAPAPLQLGVAAGLNDLDGDYYRDLSVEYRTKRDQICAALCRAGLPPSVPEGAYYVLADISRLPGVTAKDRAMHLLRATGVASVPGNAFFSGADGERWARFCYAKPETDLNEACRRLQALR